MQEFGDKIEVGGNIYRFVEGTASQGCKGCAFEVGGFELGCTDNNTGTPTCTKDKYGIYKKVFRHAKVWESSHEKER